MVNLQKFFLLLILTVVCSVNVSIPLSDVYATFHLWEIKEIYSNADGTHQFIELATLSNGQQFLSGHTLTADSDGNVQVYTWTNDSSSPTANTKILLASTSMVAVPGFPVPDFVIPDDFFDPLSSTITLNFGENSDIVTINGGIPVNGIESIDDSGLVGNASPTNYAGQTATPPFGNPTCSPPSLGDWVVSNTCTLGASASSPESVFIQNNSVLTIPSGVSLDVDLESHNVTIESGSGLLIQDDGKII